MENQNISNKLKGDIQISNSNTKKKKIILLSPRIEIESNNYTNEKSIDPCVEYAEFFRRKKKYLKSTKLIRKILNVKTINIKQYKNILI